MDSYGTVSYRSVDDKAVYNQRKKYALRTLIAVVIVVVIATIVAFAVGFSRKKTPTETVNLTDLVNTENIMTHLEDLLQIASKYNNSRAVEFGFNASVAYIVSSLKEKTNYNVNVQYFPVTISKQIGQAYLHLDAPFQLDYTYQVDYLFMGSFQGKLNFSASAFAVANFGCSLSDYEGINASQIAIILRGNCTFFEKANLSYAAGASAVLVYNDGSSSDRLGTFLGAFDGPLRIPVFSLSYVIGETMVAMAKSNDITLSLSVYSISYNVTTANVIAETNFGSAENVIVVGSHLDSVPAGPGINDNGSGSSTNLELALQLYNSGIQTINKVRFAWWGAEEMSLLGSKYYVANLKQSNPSEFANIALNLNFDMLGSPNYYIGIYNGTGANITIRDASEKIQKVFIAAMNQINQTYQLIPFDGRSDYGPFIANGIPAGGLATGAEGIKNPQQRLMFGGQANTNFDPCYHQSCDTVDNISKDALRITSFAAAYTLQTLANQENLREYLVSP